MIILPTMKSIIGKKTEKIIVGGQFAQCNDTSQFFIVKLNSNGSIDNTFITGEGFDWHVNALAVQSDGKIVVGGYFLFYDGVFQQSITRLNSGGTRDKTFKIGTGFDYIVYTIVIQSDGKILAGGNFFSYDGTEQYKITRLNPNGTRDTGFYNGMGLDVGAEVSAIAIQSDGKIVIGGNFTTYDETEQNNITRLNPDGTRDTGFMIGTGFDTQVYAIAIQSDGKIVVGGNFVTYNGISQLFITRLNPDGTRDTTFNIGTGFDGQVYAIAIQSDGKIVVGGNFTTYDETEQNNITRLNPDGTRDTGFAGLELGIPPVKSLAIQSDGKIVAGYAYSVIRLNSNGTLDTGFTEANFDNQVNSIILT